MFKIFKQIAHLVLIAGIFAGAPLQAQTPGNQTRKSGWLNFVKGSLLGAAASSFVAGGVILAQGDNPAGAYLMGAGLGISGLVLRKHYLAKKASAEQRAQRWNSINQEVQGLSVDSQPGRVMHIRNSILNEELVSESTVMDLYDSTYRLGGHFHPILIDEARRAYTQEGLTYLSEIRQKKVNDIKKESQQSLEKQQANVSWYGKATTLATVGAIAGGTLAGASLVYKWLKG